MLTSYVAYFKNWVLSRLWNPASAEHKQTHNSKLTVTNTIVGGMEGGATWGDEYIVFYSTGISPKFREEMEKIRESKMAAQKKQDKKKGE